MVQIHDFSTAFLHTARKKILLTRLNLLPFPQFLGLAEFRTFSSRLFLAFPLQCVEDRNSVLRVDQIYQRQRDIVLFLLISCWEENWLNKKKHKAF